MNFFVHLVLAIMDSCARVCLLPILYSGVFFICLILLINDLVHQYLDYNVGHIENGATWVFTGVYGPFSKVEREGMWEEFGAIRGLWDDPWCLGGDFNITLYQQERSSQRRISSAMRSFAETVEDLELVDLPLQGGEFTWNGGLNNQAWARLDRFLVSSSWLDLFSGVTQVRLSRPISDHFPIVLEGGGIRRGPTPFRFENVAEG